MHPSHLPPCMSLSMSNLAVSMDSQQADSKTNLAVNMASLQADIAKPLRQPGIKVQLKHAIAMSM